MRRGDIKSLDDLQNIWRQTNGTLEEHAEQIEKEIHQIRDRFLLMGVKPPVPFRAQGWGTYEGFQCQKFCSLYDEYWSTEATIQSWEPW